MKLVEIVIVIVLLLGLALTELHVFVYHYWKATAKLEWHGWIDKNYKEKVTVLYFLYEIEPIFKNIIWTTIMAIGANIISPPIRNVLIVFILYYFTQLAFYLYNRNTSEFANFIVYIYSGIAIVAFCIPNKKGAKLINIQDYYF